MEEKAQDVEPQQGAGASLPLSMFPTIKYVNDDALDRLVRDIFDVTNTPYWKDRAEEIAEMIAEYCSRLPARG